MKLKEMENTGVLIESVEVLREFLKICEDGGWQTISENKPTDKFKMFASRIPCELAVKNYFGSASCGWFDTQITLQQFKEAQITMKYKEGDVLVEGNGQEIKILGVCGQVYFISEEDDFVNADDDNYTEAWLDNYGYNLKADAPDLTTLTLEDVAKMAGVDVDNLRIKD